MSLAIVGGIVTVGSFGFATYAAIRTNQLEQDFRDSGNDPLIEHDGEIMAKRANIALVIGAASAVATSLFVYKAVRSRRANHATAGLVVPVITPQLAGASLQLRW